jgi:hypothetical protein
MDDIRCKLVRHDGRLRLVRYAWLPAPEAVEGKRVRLFNGAGGWQDWTVAEISPAVQGLTVAWITVSLAP